MTLRIERACEGKRVVFRLSGRIGVQNLDQLKEQLQSEQKDNTLDLEHVTLVDVDGVRFLNACEQQGCELLHCSLYIREWMNRERQSQEEV
jgi:anti-anti-sigma regulatory factor